MVQALGAHAAASAGRAAVRRVCAQSAKLVDRCAGVANGFADIVGSDHAPHTPVEKEHPYPQSHSGMTGVQTLVPTMLDHVNAGRLSRTRFVDMTSAGPNRLFGITNKGRIAVGQDADLTFVDLKRRETITNDWIAPRAGWTPYDGVSATGWPVGTVFRGHMVVLQGEPPTHRARNSLCVPSRPSRTSNDIRARESL